MSATTTTIADVAAALGVSPERVLTDPPPGTATLDDTLTARDRSGGLCELVDGTLVEKAVSWNESSLSIWLAARLLAFVSPRRLGVITGEQGQIRLAARTVRIPDVAYTSWDRLPGRRRPAGRVSTVAPDLSVEVLSPDNTPAEMLRKRQDLFGGGTRLVWEIDTDARTVTVYTAPTQSTVLTEADMLDGGDVLPGFTASISDMFTELDSEGPPLEDTEADA